MVEQDSRPSEAHRRLMRRYAKILIPALREVARRYGYALTVHGSLERDIDLLAFPWVELACDAQSLADAMFRACDAIVGASWVQMWTPGCGRNPPSGAGDNPTRKPHGRLVWSIQLATPEQYIDLGIVQTRREQPLPEPPKEPIE